MITKLPFSFASYNQIILESNFMHTQRTVLMICSNLKCHFVHEQLQHVICNTSYNNTCKCLGLMNTIHTYFAYAYLCLYLCTCIHAKKALLYNSLCTYLFEFCKLTYRLPLLEFGLSYLTSRQRDMSLSEDAFLYLVRHRFHKKIKSIQYIYSTTILGCMISQ